MSSTKGATGPNPKMDFFKIKGFIIQPVPGVKKQKLPLLELRSKNLR